MDVDELDATILSHARRRWLKVAMIAARTMQELRFGPADKPFDIVVARVRELVTQGRLAAQGDLSRPRFSEVRLSGDDGFDRAAGQGFSPMTERPGEDDLIARYFAPLAGPAGLGLKDDVALLKPPAGRDFVVTTDALVAGVHFFADDPPAAIARKALKVNLSDLAGKGTEPIGFALNLALPDDWTAEWLAAFAAGLGDDAATYRCPLIGGDTVRTPGPLTLAITAIGAVEPGRFAARGGVRPGDRLYVSGTIGDAALGLRLRLGQGPTLADADRASTARPLPSAAAAARSGACGRALRQRRNGHLRRLRWRPDQDAQGQRRGPRRSRSAGCRCRPPPAPRSAAIGACFRSPPAAATTMNSSSRRPLPRPPHSRRPPPRPASS